MNVHVMYIINLLRKLPIPSAHVLGCSSCSVHRAVHGLCSVPCGFSSLLAGG